MTLPRQALGALVVTAAMVMSTTVLAEDDDEDNRGRGGGRDRVVDFTIENLTHGITFRPFLVAAHPDDRPVFRAGQPATPDSPFRGIQLMAECGGLGPSSSSNLVERMEANDADFVANPVNNANPFDPPLGLLFPAGTSEGDTAVPFAAGLPGSVSGTLNITRRHRNTHLSVVAMLLPTNDAFAGLDSIEIPRRGTHVYYLPAYDAGTEANNEIPADDNPLDCVPGEPGYPVDPLGNNGTGGTGVIETEVSDRVHIHRGQVGDTDAFGGLSDLDSRIHRWLNPVVKLTITVRRPGRGDD